MLAECRIDVGPAISQIGGTPLVYRVTFNSKTKYTSTLLSAKHEHSRFYSVLSVNQFIVIGKAICFKHQHWPIFCLKLNSYQ